MRLLLLCRVPKDLLARNTNAQQMYQPAKTRMALVWHEKTLPREDEKRQQRQDQQQRQQRQQQRQRFEEQRRQRAEQRQHRWGPMFCDSDDYDSCENGSEDDPYDDNPYFDEDMDSYVDRMMAGFGRGPSSYRQPPEGVRFGLPQLVAIPGLHLHGGDAADKAVRKVGWIVLHVFGQLCVWFVLVCCRCMQLLGFGVSRRVRCQRCHLRSSRLAGHCLQALQACYTSRWHRRYKLQPPCARCWCLLHAAAACRALLRS
jgi:hypothetical protein